MTAPDPADTVVEQAAKVLAGRYEHDAQWTMYLPDARRLHDAGLLIAAFPDGHAGTLTGDLLTDMAAYAARMRDQRDELRATVARVATLRDRWAILAGQVMNADSREWLDAASKSLRAALENVETP